MRMRRSYKLRRRIKDSSSSKLGGEKRRAAARRVAGDELQVMERLRSFLNFESTRQALQSSWPGSLNYERRKLPRNKALKSRIVMYSLLSPLTLAEATAMLEHRCKLAEIEIPFSADVIDLIYVATGGVPRDILRICGYAYETAQIGGEKIVSRELAEASIEHERDIMEEEAA